MSTKRTILKDRASLLAKARSFFSDRKVLEVDCPILSRSASVDAHIDLIQTSTHFLHSSPEYGMKRLLVEGIGDIYQISHVFRDGEVGHKHNPEFLMAEWYRVGISFQEMVEETADFIRLFLGDLPLKTMKYRELFEHYVGIDYRSDDLMEVLCSNGIEPHTENREELLNLILGSIIEPQLGQNELFAITHYPASQCALAQTLGEEAERFEIYFQGMELCNGYHELADSIEQRRRFEESNRERLSMGKNSLPLDENFLAALEKGLPDCCGVAVGLDRLLMLRHNAKHIREVIPFDWESA